MSRSQLLMLDLFCGLKGASAAMVERGWEVVSVDIDPAFSPSVVADLSTWRWDGDRPDLVWASPPCDEFSRLFMPWRTRWGSQPDHPDLSLVNAGKRIARESGARFWIIENVKGAQRWLGKAQWVRNPVYLWGEFPPIACGPLAPYKERLSSARAADRARIPRAVSVAVAEAVEMALPLDASWSR